MGKRTKIILGIAICAITVFSGALFGLAKYGVINMKGLADPLYGRAEITVDETNTGGGMSITQNGNAVSATGSFSGNVYIIPSLAYGSYTFMFGIPGLNGQPCVGATRSLSHFASTTEVTYPKFSCEGPNPAGASIQGQITRSGTNQTIAGATIAIGGSPAVQSDGSGYYSIPDIAAGSYLATITKDGYNNLSQNVTLTTGTNRKDFNLVQTGTQIPHPLTLYLDIKTDCTDLACTNRDSFGKVNGIPVSFGTFSGVTSNVMSQGYNLQFSNVMTGNYTFAINDPAAPGYNAAYESKTISQNIYNATGSTLAIFSLAKRTTALQSATFDFIGSAKDSRGALLSGVFVNVVTPVGCVDTPSFSCPWNRSTTSGVTPANNHGVSTALNFARTDLYNIAQSDAHFSSYTGTAGKTGYQAVNFTIKATDIKVDSHGRSYLSMDITMIESPQPLSDLAVTGTVKDRDGNFIDGVKVTIESVLNKGPWETSTVAKPMNEISGVVEYNYSFQNVYNFKEDLSIQNVKIRFAKLGYYYGSSATDNQYITIAKTDINVLETSPNRYAVRVDAVLRQTFSANDIKVYGLAKDTEGKLIGNIRVQLKAVNSSGSTLTEPELEKDEVINEDHNYSLHISRTSGRQVNARIILSDVPDYYVLVGKTDISPIDIALPSVYGYLRVDLIFQKIKNPYTLTGTISTAPTNKLQGDISVIARPQYFRDGSYINGPAIETKSSFAEISNGLNQSSTNYKLELPTAFNRVLISFVSDARFEIEAPRSYTILNEQFVTTNNSKYYRIDKSVIRGAGSLMVKVADKITGKPIPDAQVTIHDQKLGNIVSGRSDAIGSKLFDSDEYVKYVSSSRAKFPELIIEKGGYLKCTYYYSISNSENTVRVMLSPDAFSQSNLLDVSVRDKEGNALTDAKIKIWKGSTTSGNLFRTAYTNNRGEWNTSDLKPGNYVVVAQKDGYLSTSNSAAHISQSNSKQEVNLQLEKISQGLQRVRVTVLEVDSLKPIEGVKISIAGDLPTESIRDYYTLLEGNAEIFLLKGVSYQITAKLGTITQTKTLTLPSDYEDLNSEQQLSYFPIFFMKTQTEPGYSKVKFTFVNDETDQPVPNLKVEYVPVWKEREIMSIDSLQKIALTANTNRSGTVELITDFSAPNNDLGQFKANKQLFTQDEDINLITPPGYNPRVHDISLREYKDEQKNNCIIGQTCEIIIRLTADDKQGSISVDLFNGNNAKPVDDEISQQLRLEKYNGNLKKWEDSGLSAYSGGRGPLEFSPVPNGIYHAVLLGYATSESVEIKNDKKTIFMGVCAGSENYKVINYVPGIKFIFTTKEQFDQFQQDPTIYYLAGDAAKVAKQKSINIGNLLLYFNNDEAVNAFAINFPAFIGCSGYDKSSIMQVNQGMINLLKTMNTPDTIKSIVAHEYAHLLYARLEGEGSDFSSKFEDLFSQIKSDPESAVSRQIYDLIKDGNIHNPIRNFTGHPEEHATEAFASFFSAYFLNHDVLHGAIKYHLDEQSKAQNILAFIWNMFAEKIGRIYSNDATFFPALGGSVIKPSYGYSQIKSGVWRAEIFRGLNLYRKSNVLYSQYVAPVTGGTTESVMSAITQLNNKIYDLMVRLGLLQNVGSAYIIVKDADGKPKQNAIVQVGSRFGITDASGQTTITNIPIGLQAISKIKSALRGTNLRPISSAENKITILKNSTATKIIIVK